MFTGEYRHSVDDKGRLAVPARFRPQLQDGAFVSLWLDTCLAIHSRAGFERLASRFEGALLADDRSRLLERRLFSAASEVELDKQGRIVIPAFLREKVGLAGDAVVVGAREHAEIWVPALWTEYSRALEDQATFAKGIDGLSI